MSGRPFSVSCISPEKWIHRLSPLGSTMRVSSDPKVKTSIQDLTVELTSCLSSGWMIGQQSTAASSKVNERPASSTNSGEHQNC